MLFSGTQSLLAGFFGMLGIITGIIVSSAAREELAPGKKTFSLLSESLFLFIAGIFFLQAGFIIMTIALLLCGSVLHAFKGQEQSKIIAFMTIIMLLLSFGSPLFPLVAGFFLLIGLVEGGYWSARHEKILEKGVLRKELWRLLFQEHALYLILPFASIIFLL